MGGGDGSQTSVCYNEKRELQQCDLTYDQIHNKLLNLFNAQASFDEISSWIDVSTIRYTLCIGFL